MRFLIIFLLVSFKLFAADIPTPLEVKTVLDKGIFHVSEIEGYTINSKPAKSIYVGADDGKYLELTFSKEKFKGDNLHLIGNPKDPNFNLSLLWSGDTYVLSSKHNTHLTINIDADNKAHFAGRLFKVGSSNEFVVF